MHNMHMSRDRRHSGNTAGSKFSEKKTRIHNDLQNYAKILHVMPKIYTNKRKVGMQSIRRRMT